MEKFRQPKPYRRHDQEMAEDAYENPTGVGDSREIPQAHLCPHAEHHGLHDDQQEPLVAQVEVPPFETYTGKQQSGDDSRYNAKRETVAFDPGHAALKAPSPGSGWPVAGRGA